MDRSNPNQENIQVQILEPGLFRDSSKIPTSATGLLKEVNPSLKEGDL
jgi:hypothetical protein